MILQTALAGVSSKCLFIHDIDLLGNSLFRLDSCVHFSTTILLRFIFQASVKKSWRPECN